MTKRNIKTNANRWLLLGTQHFVIWWNITMYYLKHFNPPILAGPTQHTRYDFGSNLMVWNKAHNIFRYDNLGYQILALGWQDDNQNG
jgi:hypothetical protein